MGNIWRNEENLTKKKITDLALEKSAYIIFCKFSFVLLDWQKFAEPFHRGINTCDVDLGHRFIAFMYLVQYRACYRWVLSLHTCFISLSFILLYDLSLFLSLCFRISSYIFLCFSCCLSFDLGYRLSIFSVN